MKWGFIHEYVNNKLIKIKNVNNKLAKIEKLRILTRI